MENNQECYWILSENKATETGIPHCFQGVFFLDSTAPFGLTIKLCAELPGGVAYYFFPHGGIWACFSVFPDEFPAVLLREHIFENWTGACSGEFIPYPNK